MYTGNKVGLGLLSTADKSVPVSPRSGDCSKVERNGRRSGRPVIVMLKWRQWVENDLPVTAIVNSTLEGGDYRNGVRMLSAVFAVAVPDVAVEWYRCGLVGWYAQPLWAEAFAWPSDQPIATQQCSNRQKAEANRLVCSEQALSSFFSFTGVINPTLRWRCHRCSGWTENNHRCCSLRSHFSEDNVCVPATDLLAILQHCAHRVHSSVAVQQQQRGKPMHRQCHFAAKHPPTVILYLAEN